MFGNSFCECFEEKDSQEGLIAEPNFSRRYRAYSSLYWNSQNKSELEKHDKIIMPRSASKKLCRTNKESAMTFEICYNNGLSSPKISYCSVMEFTAPEGIVYLPVWMMINLDLSLTGDSIVTLTKVSLPDAKYAKFEAHESNFAMLPNSYDILIQKLKFYSCLKIGDTIRIEFDNYNYGFDIVDVNPKKHIENRPYAVSLMGVDINVEIEFKNDKIVSCDEEREGEGEEKETNNTSSFKKDEVSGSKGSDLNDGNNNDNNNNYRYISTSMRGEPLGVNKISLSKSYKNTKKIKEEIGIMIYIYEIDDNGHSQLIQRLPSKNFKKNILKCYEIEPVNLGLTFESIGYDDNLISQKIITMMKYNNEK